MEMGGRIHLNLLYLWISLYVFMTVKDNHFCQGISCDSHGSVLSIFVFQTIYLYYFSVL